MLLPGLLTDGSLWSPVIRALSPRYQSVSCSQRTPAESRRQANPAESLLGLLNDLGLASAHLVSHGSSWSAAAWLAVQAPQRVRSVTAIDPVVPLPTPAPAFNESWHIEMLLQWLATAHGNVVRAAQHALAVQAVVAQQTHVRMPEPESFLPEPCPGRTPPPLSSLRCPLLALVGHEAPAEAKRSVAEYFGQARQCRLVPVPGAHRHSPIEAPVTVARLIEEFLA